MFPMPAQHELGVVLFLGHHKMQTTPCGAMHDTSCLTDVWSTVTVPHDRSQGPGDGVNNSKLPLNYQGWNRASVTKYRLNEGDEKVPCTN